MQQSEPNGKGWLATCRQSGAGFDLLTVGQVFNLPVVEQVFNLLAVEQVCNLLTVGAGLQPA